MILEVRPRTAGALTAVPLVRLKTKREAKLQTDSGVTVLRLDDGKAPPFLITDAPLTVRQVGMVEREYRMRAAVVSEPSPSAVSCDYPRKVRRLTSS